MKTTVKLYAWDYSHARTYLLAVLFVVGNVLFPQLCHLVPGGGLTWLPIYFFTLIAAYKYGIFVGVLTALFSPLVNHFLFAMPAAAVLPALLAKSCLLAIAAAVAARYAKRISLGAVVLAVLGYQVLGCAVEWGLTGSFMTAVQDFRIGVPGILLQIFGGYALLRVMAKW
ncbi:MAG: ECF transporter S component [Prevotellaceae bacterium]|jgi:hypothetical protein|nr:ECF transporter S component [Prevotellaceae bacterium]